LPPSPHIATLEALYLLGLWQSGDEDGYLRTIEGEPITAGCNGNGGRESWGKFATLPRSLILQGFQRGNVFSCVAFRPSLWRLERLPCVEKVSKKCPSTLFFVMLK
jgi:hypothetical protein